METFFSTNPVWPGSSSTPGPDDEVAHMQHALRDTSGGMIPASDQSSADVMWGLNVDADGNVFKDRGACILDCVDFQPSSSAHIRISGHVSNRVQVLTFESAAMFPTEFKCSYSDQPPCFQPSSRAHIRISSHALRYHTPWVALTNLQTLPPPL